MGRYEDWNRGIALYFTSGVSKGSPIFLSLDSEAIEDVASGFLDEHVEGDAERDFLRAVRRKVLTSSQVVNIKNLEANIDDIPGGVAFLGLMVYAAYKMQEEEGIDESNYFLRLQEVLLLFGKGRPEGMPAGEEEPLWKSWNNYLVGSGFHKTAHRGSGPRTYLRYVMSQAILRESDKHYLQNRFRDADLPLQLDCDQLGFWLSNQHITRKHLSEGLNHVDTGRVWEFYKAAHLVYENGDWKGGSPSHSRVDRRKFRNIECGLYRTEDLLGESEYYLLPKQPPRMRSTSLTVKPLHEENSKVLQPLRSGFFAPLWASAPFVEEALEFALVGDPGLQKLLFPKRDFWILLRDPENHYGAWATWKPYFELGEQLLVLCRKGLFEKYMTRFKEEGLLNWADLNEREGWVEYYGCMVISYDWSGLIVTPECQPLANALAPRNLASVALIGGLRDPNQSAWLEGHTPTVKVYGFDREFELVVTSSFSEEVYHEEVRSQQEVNFPGCLGPGTYQIEVMNSGQRVAVRMIRVIPWANIQEKLEPAQITNSSPASTGGLSLRGPMIIDSHMKSGGTHA